MKAFLLFTTLALMVTSIFTLTTADRDDKNKPGSIKGDTVIEEDEITSDLQQLTKRSNGNPVTKIEVSMLTGDHELAGTDANHKIQITLKDGTKISDLQLPKMIPNQYTEFTLPINVPGKCIEKDDTEEICIIACGGDGLLIKNISTKFIFSCDKVCPASEDNDIDSWVDSEGAPKIPLTHTCMFLIADNCTSHCPGYCVTRIVYDYRRTWLSSAYAYGKKSSN